MTGRSLTAHVELAMKNWGAVLGVVLGAVGVFSLWEKYNSAPITGPIVDLVDAYRAIFHPIVSLPFRSLGISLIPVVADILVVWLAFGGAVGRTVVTLFAVRPSQKAFTVATRIGEVVNWFSQDVFRRFIFVFVSAFIWPVILGFGLRWPHVVRLASSVTVLRSVRRTLIEDYICDLRVVFLVQLLGLGLAVIALSVGQMLTG